jgi:hypothetical protein
LTAKSSEVLLAAGVILSTANHFQHGSLFTTTIIDNGKLLLVDTLLFQIWIWTQAIGFKASAGVVLAGALDAHRNRDVVKRNVLLTLMGGLALVGTTMLVMAFIEAATGFKERDLPTAYGVTMSALRGVVSVAYVTVGRVKNRRFSGPEVVPMTTMPDLTAQLRELNEQLRQIAVNTEHRLERMEARTEQTMRLVNQQLSQLTETHQEQNDTMMDKSVNRSHYIGCLRFFKLSHFQALAYELTYTPALCYCVSMNSVYLVREPKTLGWMIHRNRNRATNALAV